MEVKVLDLEAGVFAPFGQVIAQPQGEAEASGPGWQYWGQLARMAGGDRPYAIGTLDLRPAALRFDWAERHMHSDELIVPLGGDCLVHVAPADYPEEPDRLPEMGAFRVFRIRQGQAVLLHRGVWHGAPAAVDRPVKAMVILLDNSGAQDAHIQRFEDRPLSAVLEDLKKVR